MESVGVLLILFLKVRDKQLTFLLIELINIELRALFIIFFSAFLLVRVSFNLVELLDLAIFIFVIDVLVAFLLVELLLLL